jgi:hypothetical protein
MDRQYGHGYDSIRVSTRMGHADASRPDLVQGLTGRTFTAMVAGVLDAAIRAGLVQEQAFEQGIRDLYRTAEPDDVFCYTIFKAIGSRR